MQLLYSCCLFCVSILSHTQLLSSTSSVVSAAACSLVLWASRELRREPRQSHCGIVSPPLQPSCCCCALHPLQRTSTPPQRGLVDLLPMYHSGSSLVGFRHRFASSFGLACSNLFGLSQLWRCTPSTPTHCPHRLPSSAALILRGEWPRSGSLVEDSSAELS
jgi:hypothetical protein